MLQAFVITLREGLEAFLIVAISLAYLKKTGRRALLPAVHWGIAAAVALSVGAGLLLARARNQALWEGVLGVAAAFLVASLTVHMWRAGRYMKKDIEVDHHDRRLHRDDRRGVHCISLVPLRPSRQPRAVLPGHGDLTSRVRGSTAHLRFP
ncbi:MAG: FTR1 family protein [Acidobacteria bacterium]|nr:FTR1 family protein [Acidobacteriota bacterium]